MRPQRGLRIPFMIPVCARASATPSAAARVQACGKPAVRVRSRSPVAAPTEQDKLAEVVEAGTAIARGLDLDDTLRAVVEAATRVTRARYGALGVLGPDHRISR